MSNRGKSSKLFIANLSSRISKDELEDKFGRFGKILDLKLKEGRDRDRFAFIEYEDIRDAEDAYEKLQNEEMNGRKLRIEYSHGGRRERSDHDAKESTHCFVCNQKGHWASDCPNGAQQGIKKGTCFICGSSNHKMRHCPKNKRRNGSRSHSRHSRSRSGSRNRHSERRRRDRSPSSPRDRSQDRSRRHYHKKRSNSRENRRRSRESSRRNSRNRSGSRNGSRDGNKRRERSNSRSRS